MTVQREAAPFSVHRRLFGWMISHQAGELFSALERPTVDKLPLALARHVYQSPHSPFPKTQHEKVSIRYAGQAVRSLSQNTADISKLFRLAVSSEDASLRRAALVQSPDFVAAVANFAKLPDDEIDTYFHIQKRSFDEGLLNLAQFQADSRVLVQLDEVDPTRGCPFAKNRESSGARDPLFDSFVRWGAQLSMHASVDLVTPALLQSAGLTADTLTQQ